jgi:hypothetical protein
MLIDRPVEIGPLAGDLQVGLIDEPPVTRSVTARPGSLDELRGENAALCVPRTPSMALTSRIALPAVRP